MGVRGFLGSLFFSKTKGTVDEHTDEMVTETVIKSLGVVKFNSDMPVDVMVDHSDILNFWKS